MKIYRKNIKHGNLLSSKTQICQFQSNQIVFFSLFYIILYSKFLYTNQLAYAISQAIQFYIQIIILWFNQILFIITFSNLQYNFQKLMGWLFDSDNKKKGEGSSIQNNAQKKNKKVQIFENIRQYQSSKECHTDPEDEKYMLCTEKIKKNGKQQVKETRVPVTDPMFQMKTPIWFPNFFDNFHGRLLMDIQMPQLVENELTQSFDKIPNYAFLPFFTLYNPLSELRNEPDYRNIHKNPQEKPYKNEQKEYRKNDSANEKKSNQSQFFNSQPDYKIRDL